MDKIRRAMIAAIGIVSGSLAVSALESVTTIHQLAQQNYCWTTTVSTGDNSRRIEVKGKGEKDGFAALTVRFGDRTVEGYLLENHAFVTSPDTKWKDIPEMEPGESPTIFMDRMVRTVKLPAAEIAELTRRLTNEKEVNGVFTADLDEGMAKDLLQRGRGKLAKREEPSHSKGNFKLWTTNGMVSKYQYTLSGKQQRDGKEVDVTRTVTVEIKDVGTTTVSVPDRIKEKLLKAKAQNEVTAVGSE